MAAQSQPIKDSVRDVLRQWFPPPKPSKLAEETLVYWTISSIRQGRIDNETGITTGRAIRALNVIVSKPDPTLLSACAINLREEIIRG